MEEEPLVTSAVIIEKLGIPRSTLYRLIELGKIPTHDVSKPWHQRQRVMFKVSEVEAALQQFKDTRSRGR